MNPKWEPIERHKGTSGKDGPKGNRGAVLASLDFQIYTKTDDIGLGTQLD